MKKQRTLKQILIAKLGQAWMVWGPRNEVKARCKVKDKPGWYKCEQCKDEREKIEIDHIYPVVKPEDGFIDWNSYIASKFVEASKLRGLCRDCHREKTKKENQKRKEIKKCKKHVSLLV